MTDSPATASNHSESPAEGNQTLTVRDNRTGQDYDVPIADGAIKAADIGKIKTRRIDDRGQVHFFGHSEVGALYGE